MKLCKSPITRRSNAPINCMPHLLLPPQLSLPPRQWVGIWPSKNLNAPLFGKVRWSNPSIPILRRWMGWGFDRTKGKILHPTGTYLKMSNMTHLHLSFFPLLKVWVQSPQLFGFCALSKLTIKLFVGLVKFFTFTINDHVLEGSTLFLWQTTAGC